MKFSDIHFKRLPIIAILRGYDPDLIDWITMPLLKAGFWTLEITMNSPAAPKLIKKLSRADEGLNIGAGTVRTMDELNMALDAGAKFIVMPISDEKIIRKCNELGIPVFPGAYTPNEIYQAWTAGATAVKVFPTVSGGITHIKAVKAPLEMVPLVPTGGINMDNMEDYLNIGVHGLGMGSQLFPKHLIEAKNWKALRKHYDAVKQVYDQWKSKNR